MTNSTIRRLTKSLGAASLGAVLVFGTAACGDDEIEDPVEQEIEDEITEGEQIEDAVEDEIIEEVEEDI